MIHSCHYITFFLVFEAFWMLGIIISIIYFAISLYFLLYLSKHLVNAKKFLSAIMFT